MTAPNTPRSKLLLAVALIAILIAASAAHGITAALAARLLLATVAVVAFGWWLHRRRGTAAVPAPRRRMAVLDRAGLSPRCALALVAVDGREFLVAFGDGFAEIAPTAGTDRSMTGGAP